MPSLDEGLADSGACRWGVGVMGRLGVVVHPAQVAVGRALQMMTISNHFGRLMRRRQKRFSSSRWLQVTVTVQRTKARWKRAGSLGDHVQCSHLSGLFPPWMERLLRCVQGFVFFKLNFYGQVNFDVYTMISAFTNSL